MTCCLTCRRILAFALALTLAGPPIALALPAVPPATRPAAAVRTVPATTRPAPPAQPVAAATTKPTVAVAATQPAPPLNSFSVDAATIPNTPGAHVVRAAVRLNGKSVRFRFWLYLPPGYGHGDQSWPVVMSLHNKGMIGGDGNGSITGEGLPYLLTHDHPDGRWAGNIPANPIDVRANTPFICVAPQCPTAHTFDEPGMLTVIDRLLETVVADCHGDPWRTYLTGFSYGASNTWLVGSALADHFAAIAPIDGRATADPAATVARLGHTAVYQVVGGNDGEFLPEAKRMVAALAAGPHPDFAFHTVPGGNHFCYGSVYGDASFWNWMFARRRVLPPSTVGDVLGAVPGVSVLVDTAALPRRPGYAVIRPVIRVDGQALNIPIGIWLPTAFPHYASPLPVVVSLHNRYAIGRNGTNDSLLGEGLPMILATGNPNHGEHGEVPLHPVNPATDCAFIGVFPQCPKGQQFEAGPMPEIIDKVAAALLAGYGPSVADRDRVYLTGWSYGASCTWAVASQFPQRFAAIAINDGRAMPDPAAAVAKLKDIAVYLSVGDRDGGFIDEERKMLDALSAARHPNFVHRMVRNGDHGAYTAVYADPAFWGWLMAQHRRPTAAVQP